MVKKIFKMLSYFQEPLKSSDGFINLEFQICKSFKRIFVMISFSTGKLRKITGFGLIRSLFSFSNAQTEKNSWTKLGKQIGENI